jgi:outer membrane immunogenic protein
MTKELLAGTALVMILAASPAFAADLAPQPVEPAAPVAIPYDWSGPYVGLHAGGGWGRESDDQSRLFPGENGPGTADHFNVSGFVGGAHVGYNYQMQQFVIGAEADLDYADLKGSHPFSYLNGARTGSLRLKSDVQGSARLRAGYAFDNFLLYATGGIALANGKLDVDGVGSSKTHVGWTVGGGLEYAFTQNWIGRAEVRYTDFSKETYQTIDGPVKSGWDQTTATLGVSYKF